MRSILVFLALSLPSYTLVLAQEEPTSRGVESGHAMHQISIDKSDGIHEVAAKSISNEFDLTAYQAIELAFKHHKSLRPYVNLLNKKSTGIFVDISTPFFLIPLQKQMYGKRLDAGAVSLTTEVLRAWVRVIFANEKVVYREKEKEVAGTMKEVANRMQAAGNLSELASAKQQELAYNADIDLLVAKNELFQAKLALAKVLGLTDAQLEKLKIPNSLPSLPKQVVSEKNVLSILKQGSSYKTSSTIATEMLMDIRSKYQTYLTAWQIAHLQRDKILKLRVTILNETQLRYNGMLFGFFELMQEAKNNMRATESTIDATQQFFLANIALGVSLVAAPIHGAN